MLKDMVSSSRNVYLLNNAFLNVPNHTSGGDVRFIDIILNSPLNKSEITLYTSNGFRNLLEKYIRHNAAFGIKIKFIMSPKWFDYMPTVICYSIRTIWLTFKIANKRDVLILSASDQFPDLIPVMVNKSTSKLNIVGFCSYHLLPSPFRRHGNFIINFLSSSFQRYVFRLSKHLDFCIYPTKFYAVKIHELFGNRIKSIVLPMQLMWNSKSNISLNKFVKYNLIYLGRIAKNKGVFHIPPILMQLDTKKAIRIGIIGSGKKNVVSKLIKQIKSLDISVDFLGHVTDEEKIMLLSNSDCLMLTSEEEGFSLTILEALSLSSEVVAWNIPELKSIYGDKIWYANQNDVKDFANQIESAIQFSISKTKSVQVKDTHLMHDESKYAELNKFLKELNEN